MAKSPLYHPVRIASVEPLGAKIPANSAVSIVSATAKTYGSGVIRSKRNRKREVTCARGGRGFAGDEVESAPEFELTFRVSIAFKLERRATGPGIENLQLSTLAIPHSPHGESSCG